MELVDVFDRSVDGGEGADVEHLHRHEDSVDLFFGGAGFVNFTELDQLISTRSKACLLSNGLRTCARLARLVEGNCAVDCVITVDPFDELLMWIISRVDHCIGMSGHELNSEIAMGFLAELWNLVRGSSSIFALR